MLRRALDHFHRYQHILMFGGAAALTAAMLVVLVVNSVSAIIAHTARETDRLSFSERSVAHLTAQVETLLATTAHDVELTWTTGRKDSADLKEEFRENGYTLRVQPASDILPMMIVGAPTSSLSSSDFYKFVNLTRLLAARWTVAMTLNSNRLTTYVYTLDRSLLILAVSPGPSEKRWPTLLSDRSSLFDTLVGTEERPIWPANAPFRRPDTGRPTAHWLAPYESPLMGQRAIRVMTGVLDAQGHPVCVFVVELPEKMLTESLPPLPNGTLILLAADGTVIDRASRQAVGDDEITVARQAAKSGAGSVSRRVNMAGHWVAAWRVGDTGLMLVYVQSWLQVAKDLRVVLLTLLTTTIAIIVLIWALVLLFNGRIYKPVLMRAARVFESEQLSRTLIDTAPAGLGLIALKNGIPLLRSRMMAKMAPTLPAELVARHRVRNPNSASGSNGVTHEELMLRTRDGDLVHLAVSVAPARYHGEDVLVTAFADVTAQKQLEQTLREAQKAADSANAAKSTFLATMSHEIRTPLNAILGNLELLSHSQLDTLQRDRLKTILASSNNLTRIISDVLDFSKIEAGEMTLERITFNAVEVASHALTVFAPIAYAKGLRLAGLFGILIELPIRGDPTRLEQIFNNLLSNAIKFTERGEVLLRLSVADGAMLRVEVEDTGIGMTPEQQESVFHPFSQADATINRRFGGTGLGLTLCARLTQAMGGNLSVRSERGNGSCFTVLVPLGDAPCAPAPSRFDGELIAFVAASDAWHAFAVPALQAWGLTVRACRHPAQIDEIMLDEVDVAVLCGERETWDADDEARLLDGASWVVDCSVDGPSNPVADGRLVRVSSYGLSGLAQALAYALLGTPMIGTNETHKALSRRLKVLVAEDNVTNRRLFEEQLTLLGCETVTVENGELALAQLTQQNFDVLVTDLLMPVMDGYALAREARRRWPQMPVIAATATVTLKEYEGCEAAGVARVVSKPMSLASLREALSAVTALPEVETQAEHFGKTVADATDAALDVLGGRALPDDVCQTFLRSAEKSLVAINIAGRTNDELRMLAELHSLRGALNVFRKTTLAEQCGELERFVRNHGIELAADLIEDLDIELHATILREVRDPTEALSLIFSIMKRSETDRATERVRRILRSVLVS
ncbi:ATP-binding protein [Paraburkholderia dinghuensis]|uniref:Virulence sensor protein BvgS n=1 Tax=Paraburkholderia dinghuensis TaxID=2305225 RepID=A0A3N6Q413_9BURK|nr:ATP-binding protein [Paraburkholderia dinghuensis]RQH07126.1 response regulator [Paraburkholderia dinghuensis]